MLPINPVFNAATSIDCLHHCNESSVQKEPEIESCCGRRLDGTLVNPNKVPTSNERHMKVVYLAHPFGGKQENVDDAKEKVRELVKKFPNHVFLSPLQATGFYYDDIPYLDGMEHCLELLSRSDEIWFCENWQDSKGCMMEYAFATAQRIPIYEVLKRLK